jgi:hypothetical protein
MFAEGLEAEFFEGPDECARKCFELLANDVKRLRMATAAKERVRILRVSNDEVMDLILGVNFDFPNGTDRNRGPVAFEVRKVVELGSCEATAFEMFVPKRNVSPLAITSETENLSHG